MKQLFTYIKEINFLNPEFLLLLVLLPALAYFYYKRYRTYYATLRMPTLEPMRGITSWRGSMRASLPIFRSLAFIALVIAMARPQLTLKEEEVNADDTDNADFRGFFL